MKTLAEQVLELNTINQLQVRLTENGGDFEQDFALEQTIEHFEDGSKLIYFGSEVIAE